MSHVEGKSIGEAYLRALKLLESDRGNVHWYLSVHISRPIERLLGNAPSSFEIRDWHKVINIGEDEYRAFVSYQFSTADHWTGGKSGEDWINGRIRDRHSPNGYYNKALRNGYRFDQLEHVKGRLQKKMHGGSTNALVCQVFLPEYDLLKACRSVPRVSGVRCLSLIDFKPLRDELNLMAVFRSQYFDTKACGNFIALAILLYRMCQDTGYKPGAIVSTADKVTFAGDRGPLCKHFRNVGLL